MNNIFASVDQRGAADVFKQWTSLGNIRAKLHRISALLESGGHRLSKLDQLKIIVPVKYLAALDNYLPVHDNNLKLWSLKAAKIVSFPNFRAGATF